MIGAAFYGLAAAALLASWWADPVRTRQALRIGSRSLGALVPKVLGMVALIGLVLAVAPPDALRRIFALGGLRGFVAVAALGSVVTMPGPIAFPLVGSLAKLGAPPATLAAFVTTLTMVGVVTAPMEVSHFGPRFTLLRQGLSFATAILIGVAMGVFL